MSETKEINMSEENVSLDETKTNEELRLLKSKIVDDQILNLKLFIKNLEKNRKFQKCSVGLGGDWGGSKGRFRSISEDFERLSIN